MGTTNVLQAPWSTQEPDTKIGSKTLVEIAHDFRRAFEKNRFPMRHPRMAQRVIKEATHITPSLVIAFEICEGYGSIPPVPKEHFLTLAYDYVTSLPVAQQEGALAKFDPIWPALAQELRLELKSPSIHNLPPEPYQRAAYLKELGPHAKLRQAAFALVETRNPSQTTQEYYDQTTTILDVVFAHKEPLTFSELKRLASRLFKSSRSWDRLAYYLEETDSTRTLTKGYIAHLLKTAPFEATGKDRGLLQDILYGVYDLLDLVSSQYTSEEVIDLVVPIFAPLTAWIENKHAHVPSPEYITAFSQLYAIYKRLVTPQTIQPVYERLSPLWPKNWDRRFRTIAAETPQFLSRTQSLTWLDEWSRVQLSTAEADTILGAYPLSSDTFSETIYYIPAKEHIESLYLASAEAGTLSEHRIEELITSMRPHTSPRSMGVLFSVVKKMSPEAQSKAAQVLRTEAADRLVNLIKERVMKPTAELPRPAVARALAEADPVERPELVASLSKWKLVS